MLVVNASLDYVGGAEERSQKHGTVQPLGFSSRSTLSYENKLTASELEMAAVVWLVNKNRPLFHYVLF